MLLLLRSLNFRNEELIMKVCLCCFNPEVFPYDGKKQIIRGACRWAVVPDDTPVDSVSDNSRPLGHGCISHEVMEKAGLVRGSFFWQKPNGRDFYGEVKIIEGRFASDPWVDKMADNREELISYLNSSSEDQTTEGAVKHWLRVAGVTSRHFNRLYSLSVSTLNVRGDYGPLYSMPSGANHPPFEVTRLAIAAI